MSDEYVFSSASNDSETGFEFLNKQYNYISDSNGNSYNSGQIQFDLANFSNSGRYFNFKESTLVIPLVLAMKNTPAAGGSKFLTSNNENAFSMSLKNGVHQIINSISLQLSNNEIVTIQPFQNLLINYKILSSFSTNDVVNNGPTLLFSKDTTESARYVYGAAAVVATSTAPATTPLIGTTAATYTQSSAGMGVCNNSIVDPGFNPKLGFQSLSQNKGRLDRMKWTSLNSSDVNLSPFLPSGFGTATYKNSVVENTDSNITYNILATIPLRFLHDYFLKAPLAKNCYYKLVVNTHTNCTATIGYTTTVNSAAGTLDGTVKVTTVSSFTPYGILPFQISPLSGSGGGSGLSFDTAVASNSGVLNAALTIAKTTISTAFEAHPLTTCRIYGSMIEMTPIYEEMYLTNKIKIVNYNDVLTFNGGLLTNQKNGDQINCIITNGLSRLRRLIMYTFINPAHNGVSGISPMASPFASEPGTLSPYCSISNFNVSLSGKPIYQQNKMYNFENFLEECRGSNAINGGLVTGLCNGLISQYDHDSLYGYVIVDLKRHDASEDNISKSVQLQFTNASPFTCDYIVHIEYEKQLNLDVELGTLIL